MAKTYKPAEEEVVEATVEETEAEVTETPKASKAKSKAYTDFEKLIATYKVQNPVKYAMKKEALAAKLAKLA